MGELIPQHYRREYCGAAEPHDRHVNEILGKWCTGVPPLTPFVELTVRVPLVGSMDMGDAEHSEVLGAILEEGLATYIWDELDSPETKSVLRLRVGGEDRVYPLVHQGNGMVVRELPQGA